MEIEVNWLQQAQFAVKHPSGSQINIDGPPEYGGIGAGFRPMETLLAAVGACSAFDVRQIISRQRGNLRHLSVSVSGERSEDIPRVFTRISMNFSIAADGISEAQAVRAIELSLSKYCSAAIMLKRAGVTIDYQLNWLRDGDN